MSVISRLSDLLRDVIGPDEPGPDDEARLTVAALLVLVARADGRVLEVEETGLHALLSSRFNLSMSQVDGILEDGGVIAGETDPAAAIADRILHDVASPERPRLLAMAYRVAALDGYLHEFEEDLVWRIGRLLGFAEGEIAAMRDDALKNLAPERAREP